MRSWNTVRYSPACAGRCRSCRINSRLSTIIADLHEHDRPRAPPPAELGDVGVDTSSAGSGENRTGLRASSCAQAEGGNARGERGPRGAWGARVRRRRRRAPPRWRARTAVSPAAQGARTPARAPIRALCPHPVAHTLSSRASVGDLPAGGAEDARVVVGGNQARRAEERGPPTRASVVLLWRRRGSRARGGGVWGRGGVTSGLLHAGRQEARHEREREREAQHRLLRQDTRHKQCAGAPASVRVVPAAAAIAVAVARAGALPPPW